MAYEESHQRFMEESHQRFMESGRAVQNQLAIISQLLAEMIAESESEAADLALSDSELIDATVSEFDLVIADSESSTVHVLEDFPLSVNPSEEHVVEVSGCVEEAIVASKLLNVALPVPDYFLPSKESSNDPFSVSMEVAAPRYAKMEESFLGDANYSFQTVVASNTYPYDPGPIAAPLFINVRLNHHLWPPPPKSPDQRLQLTTVEFQVMWDPTEPRPPLEPPDAGRIAVVRNSPVHSKTGVMILLQIARGFGYCLILMNSWNLKVFCHCWRFVECSEVSMLRFYPSTIARLALSYFSKGIAHQLFDEMPHKIMSCLNFLLCEFITASELDEKELLSCEFDDVSGSTFIVLYTYQGGIQYAFNMFERLHAQVVVAWNSLINRLPAESIVTVNNLNKSAPETSPITDTKRSFTCSNISVDQNKPYYRLSVPASYMVHDLSYVLHKDNSTFNPSLLLLQVTSGIDSMILWHHILDVNEAIDHITTSLLYEVVLVVYMKTDPLFRVGCTMIYPNVVNIQRDRKIVNHYPQRTHILLRPIQFLASIIAYLSTRSSILILIDVTDVPGESVFPHIEEVENVDRYEEPLSIMLWDINLSGVLTLHITSLIQQYMQELAHVIENNDDDTFALLEFVHTVQLPNMALEAYQVHVLSYMNDPSNENALKIVGLISFSTTVVVVHVPEGHSLVMPLSLAFFTKSMMHDISLSHHLAACEMGPATTIFSVMTVILGTTHMIIALACKGGKIEEYIFHYEGTNVYLPTLLSSCFVHTKGSSQFNQWDPGGCSVVH